MRTYMYTICKKNQHTNLVNLPSKYKIPEYVPSTEYDEDENSSEYDVDDQYPSIDDRHPDEQVLEEPDENAPDYVMQYIIYNYQKRIQENERKEKKKRIEEERIEKVKNSKHSLIYSNVNTNTSTDNSDW